MGKPLGLKAYLTFQGKSVKSQKQNDFPARPPGLVVWIRCADAPHLPAAQSLASRFAEDGDETTFVFTIGGPDDGQAIDTEWQKHVSDPCGSAGDLRAFLDHWTPQLLLWLGGTPSPYLAGVQTGQDFARIMVDATAADIGAAPGRWMPGMRKSLFLQFNHVITVDEQAAAALRRLGLAPSRVEPLGALADSLPVVPCNERHRAALATAIGARPVWLAADCRPGDFELVITAHQQALRRSHRLLLLLHPAAPSDASTLMERLRSAGLETVQRSSGGEPTDATQVYLVDTNDELGLWYRLAPLTFLGGTIAPGPSRHPFEVAALGSALMHGPATAPFTASFLRLQAVGASRPLRTSDDLGAAVIALLSPDKAALQAHAAWDVISSGADVANRVVELIHDTLDRAEV